MINNWVAMNESREDIPNINMIDYCEDDNDVDWYYSPFNHIKYSLLLSKEKMLEFGCDVEDRVAVTYSHSDGYCLVYIDKNNECSDTDKVALICHEAVHVWQEIKERMGEECPSIEFEAYSIQKVFRDLMILYQKQV